MRDKNSTPSDTDRKRREAIITAQEQRESQKPKPVDPKVKKARAARELRKKLEVKRPESGFAAADAPLVSARAAVVTKVPGMVAYETHHEVLQDLRRTRAELKGAIENRDQLAKQLESLAREYTAHSTELKVQYQQLQSTIVSLEQQLKKECVAQEPSLPANFEQMSDDLKIFCLKNALATAQRDAEGLRSQIRPMQEREATFNGQKNVLLEQIERLRQQRR